MCLKRMGFESRGDDAAMQRCQILYKIDLLLAGELRQPKLLI